MSTPCLYCRGEEFSLLWDRVTDRLKHVPGERRFFACQNCSSAQLHPMPGKKDIGSFYPPHYDFKLGPDGGGSFFKKVEYALFFKPQYETEVSFVKKITGRGPAGVKMLDVGCGNGMRLLSFKRLGWDVSGAELQENAVRFASEKLKLRVRCAAAEAADKAFSGEQFDLVTAFHLVEHSPDPPAIIRAAYSLLAPGGNFVMSVPIKESAQGRWFGRRWAAATEAPRHLTVPSQKGAAILLQSAGFTCIQSAPTSLLNCGGTFVLSLFPFLGRRHQSAAVFLPLKGLVGAVAFAAALPLSILENYVIKRPAVAFIAAKKPL